MPGPVPKRSDVRRNRNPKSGPALTVAASGRPEDPEEDLWLTPAPEWHPTALAWYLSLAESGQSAFYEASDVATAFYCATLMTEVLRGGRGAASMAAVVDSLQDKLLTTEGARRRARVELQRGEDEPAENPLATQLAKYRAAAGEGQA